MCQIIQVADLQHETFELLEEDSPDRLVTQSYATRCELDWEQDAEEIDEFELLDAA